MPDIKREFVFKAVLMGEGSVGKTSIRSKFMGVGFKSEYIKTIGADFASKAIILGENKVHFQIWDLAGQKMYKHVRSSFYSGCKCGFLVFDLTAPETLDKLDEWVEEAFEHSGGYLKIFIILGNKMDLEDKIKVKDGDVKKVLDNIKKRKDIEVAYLKTSALTGDNIQEAFEMMGKMFLEKEGFPRRGAEEDSGEESSDDSSKEATAPKQDINYDDKNQDRVLGIMNALNEKITRMSEIMSSLEERILLVETKRDYSLDLKEITNLREKIESLDQVATRFSDDEIVRRSIENNFSVPVPTVNDINFVDDEGDADLENMTKFNSEVIEKKDNLEGKVPLEENKAQTKCNKCGSKLSYIKHYHRWYCYQCKIYI